MAVLKKSTNKNQCQTQRISEALPLETIEKLDAIAILQGNTMSARGCL